MFPIAVLSDRVVCRICRKRQTVPVHSVTTPGVPSQGLGPQVGMVAVHQNSKLIVLNATFTVGDMH